MDTRDVTSEGAWSVRDATVDDAEALMTAHVSAVESLGPAAYDDEQVAAWAERPRGAEPYRENALADDEVFVVAEREGSVVGFGHIVPPDRRETDPSDGRPEASEVTAVYVHGDHARAGVGSTLLAHLESVARERGFDAVVLTSSTNAVGFYERRGYERVRAAVHETTGRVDLDVVVMRKRLGDGAGSE